MSLVPQIQEQTAALRLETERQLSCVSMLIKQLPKEEAHCTRLLLYLKGFMKIFALLLSGKP